MLDDISVVKTWAKVNDGMKKMYAAEVLGKLPVMQHALFGSILPFPSAEDDEELAKAIEEGGEPLMDAHGHVHGKNKMGWAMDCCGIPGNSNCEDNADNQVPSAFAQAQAGKTASGMLLEPRSGIKPIPFD